MKIKQFVLMEEEADDLSKAILLMNSSIETLIMNGWQPYGQPTILIDPMHVRWPIKIVQTVIKYEEEPSVSDDRLLGFMQLPVEPATVEPVSDVAAYLARLTDDELSEFILTACTEAEKRKEFMRTFPDAWARWLLDEGLAPYEEAIERRRAKDQ